VVFFYVLGEVWWCTLVYGWTVFLCHLVVLLMVAALCGVGENWMLQSCWGHGLDADGG
jgi:hypothetical protein